MHFIIFYRCNRQGYILSKRQENHIKHWLLQSGLTFHLNSKKTCYQTFSQVMSPVAKCQARNQVTWNVSCMEKTIETHRTDLWFRLKKKLSCKEFNRTFLQKTLIYNLCLRSRQQKRKQRAEKHFWGVRFPLWELRSGLPGYSLTSYTFFTDFPQGSSSEVRRTGFCHDVISDVNSWQKYLIFNITAFYINNETAILTGLNSHARKCKHRLPVFVVPRQWKGRRHQRCNTKTRDITEGGDAFI